MDGEYNTEYDGESLERSIHGDQHMTIMETNTSQNGERTEVEKLEK